MGKKRLLRKSRRTGDDPIANEFIVASAKSALLSNLFSMGWRLAIMVLLPVFVGVQLDKRFDSSPSLTLAAFFIAIYGAGLLIYKTYVEMTAEQFKLERRKSRLASRFKRRKHV